MLVVFVVVVIVVVVDRCQLLMQLLTAGVYLKAMVQVYSYHTASSHESTAHYSSRSMGVLTMTHSLRVSVSSSGGAGCC